MQPPCTLRTPKSIYLAERFQLQSTTRCKQYLCFTIPKLHTILPMPFKNLCRYIQLYGCPYISNPSIPLKDAISYQYFSLWMHSRLQHIPQNPLISKRSCEYLTCTFSPCFHIISLTPQRSSVMLFGFSSIGCTFNYNIDCKGPYTILKPRKHVAHLDLQHRVFTPGLIFLPLKASHAPDTSSNLFQHRHQFLFCCFLSPHLGAIGKHE